MQNLRSFWKQHEDEHLGIAQAVKRAIGQLDVAGWRALIAAVEGLIIQRTFRALAGHEVLQLDLDQHAPALRMASLAFAQPTADAEWHRPTRRSRTAATNEPWGARELEALATIAVAGVTPTTLAPGSQAALTLLAELQAGLAVATARSKRKPSRTPRSGRSRGA